jgi:hypothetical protein
VKSIGPSQDYAFVKMCTFRDLRALWADRCSVDLLLGIEM